MPLPSFGMLCVSVCENQFVYIPNEGEHSRRNA